MNETVAIVVTYNRCELLKESVLALLNSSVELDILIIDNASTDGTYDVAKEFEIYNSVKYYNTGENLGGAGGFNYGLKIAYALGYAYYWLMDDDTIVCNDALSELYNAKRLLNEQFGFLSSLALWTDGSPCKMNKHEVLSDVAQWNEDKVICQEGLIRIARATFVSFFTSRSIVETVGLPIKDYFIWGDDTEFSLRISNHYPCYYVARSTVIHKTQKNQSSADMAEMDDAIRIERMAFSLRNDFCTYRRLGRKAKIRYYVKIVRLIKNVLFGAKKYKGKKIKTIIKGFIKGLFFNPEIEKIDFKEL